MALVFLTQRVIIHRGWPLELIEKYVEEESFRRSPAAVFNRFLFCSRECLIGMCESLDFGQGLSESVLKLAMVFASPRPGVLRNESTTLVGRCDGLGNC